MVIHLINALSFLAGTCHWQMISIRYRIPIRILPPPLQLISLNKLWHASIQFNLYRKVRNVFASASPFLAALANVSE